MRHRFPHRTELLNDKKGFTLIELAMVLIIVGLLLTIGMSMLGPLTKRAKLAEARETVKATREAIAGWTVKSGYIPPDIATTGGKSVDGWGKEIAFVRATEIDTSGENVCRTIPTPNNRTTLNVCLNGDCTTQLIRNIAFVIISGGENYNIQTWNTVGAPGCPAGETCVRIFGQDTPNIDDCTNAYNCPSVATMANDPDRQEAYDDVTQYVSLDELRTASGCSQPLAITSPVALPQGEEDSYYSYQLQAIGGKPPYSWTSTTPSGLSVSPEGLIWGTLNYNIASNSGDITESCSALPAISIVTGVNDSAGSTAVPYPGTLSVRPKQLEIITQTLPVGYESSPYNATITATAGKTPYVWSMSVAPSCPSGLTCSGNTITGTPATGSAGIYTVTVTANSSESGLCKAQKTFSLTVNVAPESSPTAVACTLSASPSSIVSGQATTLIWTVKNGPTSGTPGATLTPSAGSTCDTLFLSPPVATNGGSCTTGTIAATTTFTMQVTNAQGTNKCMTTVNVGQQPAPPACTLTANPSSGSSTTLSWNSTNNPISGAVNVLSGTATLAGGCNPPTLPNGSCTASGIGLDTTFQLSVTNPYGTGLCAASANKGVSGICTAPSITTASLPNGRIDVAYTATTIAASGGVLPYIWSWSGNPGGLALNATTGQITGTPSSPPVPGTFSPVVTLTDSCPYGAQSTSKTFTIPVAYRVRNERGSTIRVRGGVWQPGCTAVTNGNYFYVGPGETVNVYTNAACTTAATLPSVSFGTASSTDADTDGRVRINAGWALVDW